MIEQIIREMKKCVENDCFFAALALALTLPDICGRAEFPGEGNTARYIKWYNKYVGPFEKPSDPYGSDMPYLSGEMIYNFRNSFLHQGTPNVKLSKIKEDRCKISRFILEVADVYDSGMSMVSYGTNNSIKDKVLTVNVLYLISRIGKASRKYYEENKEKFDFFRYEWNDVREPDCDLWFE